MVPAPADAMTHASVLRGDVARGVTPGRHSVIVVLRGPESAIMVQRQHLQRQRRRLQLHKERWPWSLTPREDARVPSPHEPTKTGVLLRLSERTAALIRHNQQLQRRLATLQAETLAVLSSLKRPVAMDTAMLSPPSSPEYSRSRSPSPLPRPPSSLPASPAPSSSWSSPPSSPFSDGDSL